MRTDVTIDTKQGIRIPSRRAGGQTGPTIAERGDFLRFIKDGEQCVGRMVGKLINPDDGKQYICVVYQQLSGHLCEYWILPESVVATSRGASYTCSYADKAKWFFGPEFLKTPVEQQRRISELLYGELTIANNAEIA